MPTLDELLRSQALPGSGQDEANPEIEQMLNRVNQMGMAPQPAESRVPQTGMPPQAQVMPSAQNTLSQPAQNGMAQGMAPEQANVTYQMLIKAGVPPQIAKQAISEPKFLQEILKEIQKRQQLGAPSAAQAPAAPQGAAPVRPMA